MNIESKAACLSAKEGRVKTLGPDEALCILENHEKQWKDQDGKSKSSVQDGIEVVVVGEARAPDDHGVHLSRNSSSAVCAKEMAGRVVVGGGLASSTKSIFSARSRTSIEAHLGFVHDHDLVSDDTHSSRQERRRRQKTRVALADVHVPEESFEASVPDTARGTRRAGDASSEQGRGTAPRFSKSDDQHSWQEMRPESRSEVQRRPSVSRRHRRSDRQAAKAEDQQPGAVVSPREDAAHALRMAPITPTVMVDGGGQDNDAGNRSEGKGGVHVDSSSSATTTAHKERGQRSGEVAKYKSGAGCEKLTGRRKGKEQLADVVVVGQKSATASLEAQVCAGVIHLGRGCIDGGLMGWVHRLHTCAARRQEHEPSSRQTLLCTVAGTYICSPCWASLINFASALLTAAWS